MSANRNNPSGEAASGLSQPSVERIFRMNGRHILGIPVRHLDHEDAFKIPHGPDYLLGLRDVRGQGVPVIDLRLRLGMTKTEKTPHTRIRRQTDSSGASRQTRRRTVARSDNGAA